MSERPSSNPESLRPLSQQERIQQRAEADLQLELLCDDMHQVRETLRTMNIFSHTADRGTIDFYVSNNIVVEAGEKAAYDAEKADLYETSHLSFSFTDEVRGVVTDKHDEEHAIIEPTYELENTVVTPWSLSDLPCDLLRPALVALADEVCDGDEDEDEDDEDDADDSVEDGELSTLLTDDEVRTQLSKYDDPKNDIRLYQELVTTYTIDPLTKSVDQRYEIWYNIFHDEERIEQLVGETYSTQAKIGRDRLVHHPSIDTSAEEYVFEPALQCSIETLPLGEDILADEHFREIIRTEIEEDAGFATSTDTLQMLAHLRNLVDQLPRSRP